jgi:2-polyprenyl-3-methyl-5-hydroxy-6-metoxy-1,4-benzoquinol methylase
MLSLKRFLPKTAAQRVAEHWSSHHGGSDSFSPQVYWLAVPRVQDRFQALSTAGKSHHWIDYCLGFLGERRPAERMASMGCGTGLLEQHLGRLGAFRRCDAYDIAPGALEIARRDAAAAGLQGVNFELANIETVPLEKGAYDAIWFNGSLHHVSNLEEVCDRVGAALKPDGFVFISEYVGANRFDFPPRQVELVHAAYSLIPERYRRSFMPERKGELQPVPLLPDPLEVAATDPSEAVRAADILKVVGERLEVVAHHDAGGGLLQFLLSGICGHFVPEDPASMAVLDMLFGIEDALMASGDLNSDFVLLVARARG